VNTNSAEQIAPSTSLDVVRGDDHFVGRFTAMACPCEVLIETRELQLARRIASIAADCAWRIERKFSRYRDDNIVHRINSTNGAAVTVDDETAKLLDFASALTAMSEGRFDITSGVLRRAWKFDGGKGVPSQETVNSLLRYVGWDKVRWKRPRLQLQARMEIDFGGIGKEYAADAAAQLIEQEAGDISCLVNFGGDIVVKHPRRDGAPWRVGIEAAAVPGSPAGLIALRQGGLATSGDSRRFVIANGVRYSHILDARTGWPVPDAPRSVTVIANNCTQAGAFSTLAILQGANARAFLEAQGVRFWIQ
jgi:thiamine biosynthesis lipoprotein